MQLGITWWGENPRKGPAFNPHMIGSSWAIASDTQDQTWSQSLHTTKCPSVQTRLQSDWTFLEELEEVTWPYAQQNPLRISFKIHAPLASLPKALATVFPFSFPFSHPLSTPQPLPARLALALLCFVYKNPASLNIPFSKWEASQRVLCKTKAQSLAKQLN